MPRHTGLPDKVSRYDPIEFLELSKISTAFLDLNLEEQKGGIGNQLLCGHLVGFIQKNGLNAIERLPRFKQKYLEEILTKCKEKGINFELIDNPFESLNFEKINISDQPENQEKNNINLKKESNMKTPEMTEVSKKRKFFAIHFLEGVKTEFPNFASKIKLGTKRFTSTAEGFELLVPESFSDTVKEYLEGKGTAFLYQGNGNFQIEYSDKYSETKIPKTLINLCEKERKNILRILINEKFYPKKGGRGKKSVGVFSVNQSASIASSLILRINILNNNVDTLNPILKIIRRYYNTHEKKLLVTAESNVEKFTIEIKFQPEFFAISVESTEIPESLSQSVELTETTKADELNVMLDLAFEGDETLLGEILKLRERREENKKEFLHSVSGLLIEVFWEIFEKEGLKVFKVTTDDKKLQTLSQISPDEIMEPISLCVWEKLQLKK